MFGLSGEWLLHDGVPVADAMVLSHPEQLDRLRASCPPAAPTAVLAGDPCYDRILAARGERERYRRALGVRAGQRLLVLNSTWNGDSLFGDAGEQDILPLLLPRLAELPQDEYRPAAVLHPNIGHGHGPGQVRLWLDRARRAGLLLVDPLDGWRQALIAADAVLGDFGSVSYYAAALGTPVLLGSASLAALGADSPVAAFVRSAPRLDPHAPLAPQLDRLLAGHRPLPGPAECTSSDPGKAAPLLRSLCYGLAGLPEPDWPALLDPLPLPPYQPVELTAPVRVFSRTTTDGEVELRRQAAGEPAGDWTGHLSVHEETLDPGVLALADLIWRSGPPYDPRLGHPATWAAEVLARHPGCAMAAYLTGPDTAVVATRHGLRTLTTGPGGLHPAAAASALLAAGPGLPARLTVRTGGQRHTVQLGGLAAPD
ncbi:hypothetical protein ABT095_04540 [Kitasatospora sp. NPDC002227]|uniref:hypothetical protein n=1 Tax=Kitasatospora sp. NPDC002227 TaxID=3154773 RepID=UPI00332F1BD8